MTADAIEEVYRLYRPALQAIFARGRTQADIDDLVQKVFVRLLRYPPPKDLRSPLDYLCRVAWHVLNESNEHEQRERQHVIRLEAAEIEQLTADETDGRWQQEDSAAALGTEEQVQRVLRKLSRACQFALLAHRRDGLTYKQIAEELGVSVHTVKKYIGTGLKLFRRHFRTARSSKSPPDG